MKIHCIRHEAFEGLANIENWIKQKDIPLSYTHVFKNQEFPAELDFDILIIMGGTPSIYEKPVPKWLSNEKQFIARCIEKNIKVIGICLGAQLIANVLGAKVYPGQEKEIGWFPVKFSSNALNEFPFLPEKIVTFHWHGDTFDLPSGAIHLASSECTPNQGFFIDNQILALQFHTEMNEEGIERLITACGKDLIADRYVQIPYEMRKYNDQIKSNNYLIEKFLDHFCF